MTCLRGVLGPCVSSECERDQCDVSERPCVNSECEGDQCDMSERGSWSVCEL